MQVLPQAWTLAPRPGTALTVTRKRTPGFPELCPQGMLPQIQPLSPPRVALDLLLAGGLGWKRCSYVREAAVPL